MITWATTATFAIMAAFSVQSHAAGAVRPNIVFLFAHDPGYGDLASYGQPYNRTPKLDALAAVCVVAGNFETDQRKPQKSRIYFTALRSFTKLSLQYVSERHSWREVQIVA